MSTTSIRNPENLDPALWESAGLRPITEEEYYSRLHIHKWRCLDLIPNAQTKEWSKEWVSLPIFSKHWTICVQQEPLSSQGINAQMKAALEGCVEHMEWSTPQGEQAYQAARAALANTKGGA